MALRELHLFAGSGGGILGGLLLGHTPVCAVELEEHPRQVLLQRQRDGLLPWFPIWDDVRTFDGHEWAGRIDIICGGFPCQDISIAGDGDGLDGERSGLWCEMARIIREVRPSYVFVENSPMLTARGLGRVLGDLAEMGFDAEWGVLGASSVGCDHRRNRIWLLAHTMRKGLQEPKPQAILREGRREERGAASELCGSHPESTWPTQPGMVRDPDEVASGMDSTRSNGAKDIPMVASGIKNRVGRIKSIGNGQVPLCAALAYRLLLERLKER